MSNSHDFLTRHTLDALPQWQREFWAPVTQNLVAEYCWYPDMYYSTDRAIQTAARPYVVMVDGQPFHYLPANAVEYNNWDVLDDGSLRRQPNVPNVHWRCVSRGLTDGIAHVVKHLHDKRLEEAGKFAGALFHMIQDAGSAIHALEGVDGTDVALLDRLLRPPTDRPDALAGIVVRRNDAIAFEWGDFTPTLLGTTVSEAVFRFYTVMCTMTRVNRFELVPFVQHIWRDEDDQANACISRMNRRICAVTADFLYTLTCMACDRFEPADLQSLSSVDMVELEPIHRPYFLPGYEASPLAADHNIDAEGRKAPLELSLPGGTRTFERGIGTGCHAEYVLAYDLPAGVYEYFRGCVGLHARLGRQGAIDVEIRIGGRPIHNEHFDDSHPATEFKLPVIGGGMLELFVRDATGEWSNPHNHVVWAQPRLIRTPV